MTRGKAWYVDKIVGLIAILAEDRAFTARARAYAADTRAELRTLPWWVQAQVWTAYGQFWLGITWRRLRAHLRLLLSPKVA